MHHTPRCVAVVGGGSAGACAVAALAGVGSPPIHVLWYDRAPEWVRFADEHGLAASTGHPFTGGALSTYVTFYSAAPLPHHT
jgi:2-polyprenyl-6-methoxyphenol hydroxylase-like FAD-dependent oxidoreductase